jgi:hypothetical protein
MRLTLSLLFALTLAATALGQRSKLEGHVYDGNNEARPNVNILVAGGGKQQPRRRATLKPSCPTHTSFPANPSRSTSPGGMCSTRCSATNTRRTRPSRGYSSEGSVAKNILATVYGIKRRFPTSRYCG